MGHFRMVGAAWIGEDGKLVELSGADSILVNTEVVDIVEFLKKE